VGQEFVLGIIIIIIIIVVVVVVVAMFNDPA